jgi:uncharacterized PurR-regulated membrane protein YhhQ (DUF165 family)
VIRRLPVVKRRRSTALGIVAAGASVGGLIIPILVQKLIPRIGWVISAGTIIYAEILSGFAGQRV